MPFEDLFLQALARKKLQQGSLASYRPQAEVTGEVPSDPNPLLSATRPRQVNPPVQMSPMEQRVLQPVPSPPEVTKHSGGFLSRLKDALIGTVLMGPIGGVASAISPQMAHNARYNMIDYPRWVQQQGLRSKLEGEQFDQWNKLADITGRIPGTNTPTESARQRMDQQEWKEMYQKNLLDQAARRDETTRRGQDLTYQGKLVGEANKSARNFINKTLGDWGQRRITLSPELRQHMIDVGGENIKALLNQMEDLAPPTLGSSFFVDDEGQVQQVPYIRNPGPGSNVPPALPSRPTGAMGKSKGGSEGGRFTVKQYNDEIRKRVNERMKSELPDLPTNTKDVLSAAMLASQQSGFPFVEGEEPDTRVRRYRKWYAQQQDQMRRKLWGQYEGEVRQEVGAPVTPKGKAQPTGQGGPPPSGGLKNDPQTARLQAALQMYRAYIQKMPDKKEALRQKFMQQWNGVDPDKQP